ncbi:cytochrome c family protein [Limimaricola sp. G21655-S1]|uniref:c-type cytochrome n=1 Tax=Limimaricola sp. G21655-S1 TaxID=3014768 RepID=UPI0027B9008C|nr:hypothetical protein [Limimaricola sp. G21655-S1]
MRLLTALATTTTLLAAPAMAQDMEADVANGESEFARQCVSCHVIADESGEVLAGRAGRIGPNLHGVIGRQPGAVEDFRYSDAIVAYGELAPGDDMTGTAPTGDDFENVVWAHDNTVAYLQDPTSFLREALDDERARGKMAYKVRDEQTAIDISAYLATFSPDFEVPEGESGGAEDAETEAETDGEAEMTDGAAEADAEMEMDGEADTTEGDDASDDTAN